MLFTHSYDNSQLKMEILKFISKEAADPLMSLAAPLWFWKFWKIYPSQRQNLLPTLEISTQNFQNFQKNQNFGKKFPNLEFFPKFPKPQRGRQ